MELLFIVLPMLIGIGIFFALRSLFLWYWKVDRMVELLEGIDSKLLVLKNNTVGDEVIEDNNDTSKPKDHWKQYQNPTDEDTPS